MALVELLTRGARFKYVSVKTTDLAKSLSKSQQAASRHLAELEKDGLIERYKKGMEFKVRVTKKGFIEIEQLYSKFKLAIQSSIDYLDFEGRVISGLGEGSYYINLDGYKKQFMNKLGFEPFPGTLNVYLEDNLYKLTRKSLINYSSILIEGFSDINRTYGWVKCYRATINETLWGALLVLEKTDYKDDVLELIFPMSVKETTNIKDGDKVSVRVYIKN